MRDVLFVSVFIFCNYSMATPSIRIRLDFPGTSWLCDCRTNNFLSTVRNDLHIAEFFESVFAEFNDNPRILMTTEWNADIWVEDAEGFPRDRSLTSVLATHTDQPESWFALSNFGVFSKEPTDKAWVCLTAPEDWRDMHPTALAILNL
jgi:hypothetical protein